MDRIKAAKPSGQAGAATPPQHLERVQDDAVADEIEHLLGEAELWAATAAVRAGAAYPGAALERLWKQVCLLQFHDILPGSSIAWVYDEAEALYAAVIQEGEAIVETALAALAGPGSERVVFNATPEAWGGVPALGAAIDGGSVGSAPAARVQAGGSGGFVLDNGLDLDHDGVDPWTTVDDDDLMPIAPYIEDMQISYVFDRLSGRSGADSNTDYRTGNDRTSTLPEEPNPSADAPIYSTPENDDKRGNLHPANIRAVRVGLVLRSDRPDLSVGTTANGGSTGRWFGDPLPLLKRRNSQRAVRVKNAG